MEVVAEAIMTKSVRFQLQSELIFVYCFGRITETPRTAADVIIVLTFRTTPSAAINVFLLMIS